MVDITDYTEDEILILEVKGEIDASSSLSLDQAIADALKKNYRNVLVDLSKLDYISSAGLGVFMSYIQEFKQKQIYFALFGLSEKVSNVFQILGLDQLIPVFPTLEQAKNQVHGV
ncbi:MAG: STAS domain-containing protein [Cytophagales bacterium]|nr:STAS domain-containing protein [Cytophagales bacterium]